MNWSITKKERQQQPAPRGFLMEQKQKERKKERGRGRVERTRWQPDRIRVETQTAPRSLIHRGLYQNLITSEAKATAREERWNTLELSHPRKAANAEGCWGGYPLYLHRHPYEKPYATPVRATSLLRSNARLSRDRKFAFEGSFLCSLRATSNSSIRFADILENWTPFSLTRYNVNFFFFEIDLTFDDDVFL